VSSSLFTLGQDARTPIWTTAGVLRVVELLRSFVAALERRGLDWGYLVETQFESIADYDDAFGDLHAGRQYVVNEQLLLAPESNLITFPALVRRGDVDRPVLSLVQRFRHEPRSVPGWRDRAIWPAIGLNVLASDDPRLDRELLVEVHGEVLRGLGIETGAIECDRGVYGSCTTIVTDYRGQLTGLAMVYELGDLFRRRAGAPDGVMLLNSGLTGKALLIGEAGGGTAPSPVDDLYFARGAFVRLCLRCCERVGWIPNGRAKGHRAGSCLLCGRADTPVELVTKRNDFY